MGNDEIRRGTTRLGGVVDDLATEEMLGHKTAL